MNSTDCMKRHDLVGMDGIPKLQKDILGQWCTPHLKAMLTTDAQTVVTKKTLLRRVPYSGCLSSIIHYCYRSVIVKCLCIDSCIFV